MATSAWVPPAAPAFILQRAGRPYDRPCGVAVCPRRVVVSSATGPAGAANGRVPPRVLGDRVAALGATTARVVAGVAALMAMEKAAGAALSAAGIAFPAALGGMLVLLVGLFAARALTRNDAAVDAAVQAPLAPAVGALSRWLAVFFVPNLVMLPLAPSLPPADVVRLALIVVAGWAASLFSSAALASWLRSLRPRPAPAAAPPGAAAVAVPTAKPAGPPPPSDTLVASLGASTALSLAVALGSGAAGAPVAAVYGAAKVYSVALTLWMFCLGQRLPARVRTVVHPLVTCTAGTLAGLAVLAALAGIPLTQALTGYCSRGLTVASGAGGGDALFSLLGPAVVSFALQMDARRGRIADQTVAVFGTTAGASAAALFGTALAVRLMGLSTVARVAALPRVVTAPLAVSIAAIIGGNVGMTAGIVAVTGLLGAAAGRAALTAANINDPVVRGLATGCSAHGLGTAALVGEEPEAFAFSAIAMACVGVFSTGLVCVPAVRAALLALALG
ncbi:hypothetical protein MMPV_004179 [Pyropia vietnamensis]